MRVGRAAGLARMMRLRTIVQSALTVAVLTLVGAISFVGSAFALTVSGTDFSSSANYGNTPSPPSVDYTITNDTGATIYLPVTPYFSGASFFSLSNVPTSLAPNAQATITVTISNGLSVGTYSGAIDFGDAAHLSLGLIAARHVTLTVNGLPQTISFSTTAPNSAVVGGATYSPAATATSGFPVTLGASGACSMSGGVVHMLAVGTCTVAANQAGAGNYAPAPQVTQTFSVGKGLPSVALTTSGSPSESGASVTFTATVTRDDVSAAALTGSVTFYNKTDSIGTAGLSGGTAQTAINSLLPGSHSITALYNGDGNYNPANSVGLAQTVNKGGTTTVVTATPAATGIGKPVTLKASIGKVGGAVGGLKGSVTFSEGVKVIGTADVSGAKASFVTSSLTGIGPHTVKAVYSGSSLYVTSQSTTTVTIKPGVGAETEVNTTTDGVQQFPVVAPLTGGGYVIAWASNGESGSSYDIYMQRFNTNGAARGAPKLVNTVKQRDQTQPAIAGLSDGRYIIAWQSKNQDGSGLGIYAQIFTAGGAKSGAAFQVNTTTTSDQTLPSVAALPGGGFVMSWTSNGQDGSSLGVYAQRYDADGQPARREFRVNTATAHEQSTSRVIPLPGDAFVITWQGVEGAGLGLGIYAQRYNATGVKQGPAVHVNTTTAGDQSAPAGTLLSDGGYLITWQSDGQDGSGTAIYAQRYDAAGAAAGANFRVNTFTAGNQWQPSVSGFSDGGFVVTWTSNQQDGSGQGIFGQVFDADGVKVNSEFPVNTTTTNDQTQSSVAAFAGGNFVATWTSVAADSSAENIEMQLFAIPQP